MHEHEPLRLRNCPYKVSVNWELIDAFYDIRAAIAFARAAKASKPDHEVMVCDELSGRIILKL